jgi:hypothetical protein
LDRPQGVNDYGFRCSGRLRYCSPNTIAAEWLLFVGDDDVELRHRLRLIAGSVEWADRAFAGFRRTRFWRQVSCWMVAPPWLVYGELMNADDPSANKAALELRREFLSHCPAQV